MDRLLKATKACVLKPKHFFVSWNGVLTLVYSGFPPAITALKVDIAAEFPGLPKENPGSLWPKTSLAAVKDNQRLTPNQLQELNAICKSLERQISKKTVELTPPLDVREPDADQIAKVAKVVSESDDDDYWFFASKDGSRAAHYQGVGLGSTLVHDLKLLSTESQRSHLAGLIQEFKARVDTAFPGLYSWFSQDSLHCTIRGLTG